jgi:hypothetical protein
MRLVSSLVLALVVLAPGLARAQPSTGTVFISGSAFAAIERSPTSSGFGARESDGNGTVAGGMLGVGIHLTEKISARFEWSLTDALRDREEGVASSSFSPRMRSWPPTAPIGRLGGPSLGIVPIVPETKRTTSAAFAMLGYHVPAGRASIELLGGLGLLNSDLETSYDVRITAERLAVPAAYTSSTYHAVAVVGADVAVRLTEHAAVVPQVRAYALGGGLSVRPGLSLRWTF